MAHTRVYEVPQIPRHVRTKQVIKKLSADHWHRAEKGHETILESTEISYKHSGLNNCEMEEVWNN